MKYKAQCSRRKTNMENGRKIRTEGNSEYGKIKNTFMNGKN
jgi:hypothetical protein